VKKAEYIIKVSEILTPNTEEAAMSKMTVFISLSDCILNVDCALFIQDPVLTHLRRNGHLAIISFMTKWVINIKMIDS
jgi:hypothetical protein